MRAARPTSLPSPKFRNVIPAAEPVLDYLSVLESSFADWVETQVSNGMIPNNYLDPYDLGDKIFRSSDPDLIEVELRTLTGQMQQIMMATHRGELKASTEVDSATFQAVADIRRSIFSFHALLFLQGQLTEYPWTMLATERIPTLYTVGQMSAMWAGFSRQIRHLEKLVFSSTERANTLLYYPIQWSMVPGDHATGFGVFVNWNSDQVLEHMNSKSFARYVHNDLYTLMVKSIRAIASMLVCLANQPDDDAWYIEHVIRHVAVAWAIPCLQWLRQYYKIGEHTRMLVDDFALDKAGKLELHEAWLHAAQSILRAVPEDFEAEVSPHAPFLCLAPVEVSGVADLEALHTQCETKLANAKEEMRVCRQMDPAEAFGQFRQQIRWRFMKDYEPLFEWITNGRHRGVTLDDIQKLPCTLGYRSRMPQPSDLRAPAVAAATEIQSDWWCDGPTDTLQYYLFGLTVAVGPHANLKYFRLSDLLHMANVWATVRSLHDKFCQWWDGFADEEVNLDKILLFVEMLRTVCEHAAVVEIGGLDALVEQVKAKALVRQAWDDCDLVVT